MYIQQVKNRLTTVYYAKTMQRQVKYRLTTVYYAKTMQRQVKHRLTTVYYAKTMQRQMSRAKRKQAFAYAKTKGADQLSSYCTADQCFVYTT